ncbi:DegT/DnrJ/EryC1/StrS aminotransferase [Scytonema sp. HK-05]|nr:DegT/DnrJ/EryC1/StrS aminotransferase [Scytonema sp. HK-05]
MFVQNKYNKNNLGLACEKSNRTMNKPILLSTPHMGDRELEFVKEAFDTNWIAPVGPHVDAFDQEFCQVIGASHGAAIQPGDEVFCSSLTFVVTANPITYLRAKPVFINCDRISWNMNPDL